MNIAFRKLTKKEAEILTNEVKNTPNIVAVPRSRWLRFGRVFVAENDGKLSGVCVVDFFGKDWSEIAYFLVLPESRGMGVGRLLYDEAFEYLKKNHKHIYIVSRNPVVIGMMGKTGFHTTDKFGQLPSPVKSHAIINTFHPTVLFEFIRKLFVFPKKQKILFGILEKENYEKNLG